MLKLEGKKESKLFPSPYGDYYFLITTQYEIKKQPPRVSVPLRGLLFFNTTNEFGDMEKTGEISVPLRGLLFFNKINDRCKSKPLDRFPSPYGDYYFLILSSTALDLCGLQKQFAAENIFFVFWP